MRQEQKATTGSKRGEKTWEVKRGRDDDDVIDEDDDT